MSKFRYVNTRFWVDAYISDLDPIEKLLFLYLITNPATSICGVYELPLKNIALDTGLDKEMVQKVILRFEGDDKIYYRKGWILIKNFIKHQSVNPKVKEGIKVCLQSAPQDILDSLSIAYESLSQSNSNSNRDSNSNSNSNAEGASPAPEVPKEKTITAVQEIVNYLFELKGWANKDKDFYKKNKIIYSRFTKPAKDIIDVCDENIDYAKDRIKRVAEWADSRDLEWSLETVIKKFLDIDQLQERPKKPTWKGNPMYQRGGRWYVVMPNSEHKQFTNSKSEIEYV